MFQSASIKEKYGSTVCTIIFASYVMWKYCSHFLHHYHDNDHQHPWILLKYKNLSLRQRNLPTFSHQHDHDDDHPYWWIVLKLKALLSTTKRFSHLCPSASSCWSFRSKDHPKTQKVISKRKEFASFRSSSASDHHQDQWIILK